MTLFLLVCAALNCTSLPRLDAERMYFERKAMIERKAARVMQIERNAKMQEYRNRIKETQKELERSRLQSEQRREEVLDKGRWKTNFWPYRVKTPSIPRLEESPDSI